MFEFADKYRGSYNDSIAAGVCPFYCDFNGYMVCYVSHELISKNQDKSWLFGSITNLNFGSKFNIYVFCVCCRMN